MRKGKNQNSFVQVFPAVSHIILCFVLIVLSKVFLESVSDIRNFCVLFDISWFSSIIIKDSSVDHKFRTGNLVSFEMIKPK